MEKKELMINLDDIRIKGYVNRGYGMLEDGVSKSSDCITFENVYSEEAPYPMYAVDLSEYFTEEGINIHEIKSIDITAGIYNENDEEIPLEDRYQKFTFVSVESLDGYSSSDILPEHDYKLLGSDKITSLNLDSYTGYKEDGICLTNFTLEDGVGFNIQLTNGDFSDLCFLKITMLRLTFKTEGQKAESEKVEPEKIEEIVDGKWLADLSNPAIKGYINNGIELISDGVTQSESGIVFENHYSESNIFPMFAVDFSSYLDEKGLNIADVKSFEIVAIPYNEVGDEIMLTDEFQKCCFVTKDCLNGYSQSNILSSGNYKEIGSQYKTVFDLTKYNSSGTNENYGKLEDGVGFNLQLLNGNLKDLRFLVITSLKFSIM